ncbi:MAG: sugar ABC transporter permease [Ktedonobacteraceae bacterium]|nr:sugar ABC transporter permease [Ktedonobacteraceae bacterium]MBO0793940.1 sugar ABC transporter permease [Ktedonobacteraceae bacterium]
MATQTTSTRARRVPALWERVQAAGGLAPYFLVLPTMLVILVIAVYPMLDSLRISLLDNPLINSPSFVGLDNFVRVLGDPLFRTAMGTTAIFTLVSVFLEITLGLGVAVLINKAFVGRGVVRASILVPWAFPTVVSAQMWLLMYNDQIGIATSILQGLHLLAPGDTLLGSYWGVMIASFITDIWKTTPFAALLLLAGLQVIPAELYEAASVDGSTRWQQFWQITLPMLRNQLLITLLFRSLDAVRVFDLFYVFGGRKVPSMAVYANIKMFAGTPGDFAPGVAAAVVVFICGILISLILVPMMRDIMKQ